MKARTEDRSSVRRHCVYERVPLEECWRETGKPPIRTGWVETDKAGPGEKPNIRASRAAK